MKFRIRTDLYSTWMVVHKVTLCVQVLAWSFIDRTGINYIYDLSGWTFGVDIYSPMELYALWMACKFAYSIYLLWVTCYLDSIKTTYFLLTSTFNVHFHDLTMPHIMELVHYNEHAMSHSSRKDKTTMDFIAKCGSMGVDWDKWWLEPFLSLDVTLQS